MRTLSSMRLGQFVLFLELGEAVCMGSLHAFPVYFADLPVPSALSQTSAVPMLVPESNLSGASTTKESCAVPGVTLVFQISGT